MSPRQKEGVFPRERSRHANAPGTGQHRSTPVVPAVFGGWSPTRLGSRTLGQLSSGPRLKSVYTFVEDIQQVHQSVGSINEGFDRHVGVFHLFHEISDLGAGNCGRGRSLPRPGSFFHAPHRPPGFIRPSSRHTTRSSERPRMLAPTVLRRSPRLRPPGHTARHRRAGDFVPLEAGLRWWLLLQK